MVPGGRPWLTRPAPIRRDADVDWKIVRKIARDAVRIDRVDYPQCHVLTTAHDNDRHIIVDGRHYSPLIDSVEDRLRSRGVQCLSIARIISVLKGELAYADVRSPEGAFARALIAKRLKKATSWRGRYPYSHMEERIWSRILDATGARRVVGIQPGRELCVAARKRGVWVADMQHGVIAESHLWYGRRFRAQEPTEYLPNAFLVWDPGSAEVLLDWVGPHGAAVQLIGNPWISRFLSPAADDRIVQELSERASGKFARNGRRNVLVSLSWGDYNIPNGFMSAELEATVKATQDIFNWHLRLHPNQLKGFATHEGHLFGRYYDRALAGFANWQDATCNPLPLVLSHMDLHVTWSSSVCIEAAHFGIRTAVLDPRNRAGGERADFYDYYRRTGAVELVENDEAAIRAWLDANRDNARHPEEYLLYDREFANLVSFLAA